MSLLRNAFLPACLICIGLVSSCAQKSQTPPPPANQTSTAVTPEPPTAAKPPKGNTLSARFAVPTGFERVAAAEGTFGAYLRNLPLKAEGAKVMLYNGEPKGNQSAHVAVVDIDCGKRDLQQCADAVMRLRAEYLYAQKRYDDIAFKLTNGFKVDYATWRKGNRVAVSGNKTSWTSTTKASTTYEAFRQYLDFVFTYAGTLSLSKELKSKKVSDIAPGDVFIYGGSPGHAVIVADVATNPKTGERIFMLLQSYMPAQDIQVLRNPSDAKRSPWYALKEGEALDTPEWGFEAGSLKTW